jgi:lincosamide and streptogramin A transport system ATP-binding/permease protein
MSIIQITDLTFSYENGFQNIFENVSFRIDTDWRLGFAGRNGRGKTTFLNLLTGKYKYDGKIISSVQFVYFPFEVKNPERLAREVLGEIFTGGEFWRAERELSLLETDAEILNRPFNLLSMGERSKVLLAALFLREDSFLLIDEPTNHLDMRGRETLGKYLRAKSGFILVSHDRATLDLCCDHILSVNKTNIEIERGNFSSWFQNKTRRDQFEEAENAKLKKEISKLTAAARRTATWSDATEASKIGNHIGDRGFVGHKAAKIMKRAKSAERRRNGALEEKSKLLQNIETAEPLLITPLKPPRERLIEAKNLGFEYLDLNAGFEIRSGDRAALSGANGCGKSSILKAILGLIPFRGELNRASGLKISYVPQDASGMAGSLAEFSKKNGLDQTRFFAALRKLDFSREQFEIDMKNFSEGQKKKTLLAKSLCESAHLYVWDEPLNYVDVFSRAQIEELIKKYKPTMIFVEHDKVFAETVSTVVIRVGE